MPGGEQAQPPLLPRDPGAAAQGLVDGAGDGGDGDVHELLPVVAQQGEVAALRAEDLGELADVESSTRLSRSAASPPRHNMVNSTGSTATGSPTRAAPARNGPGSPNTTASAAITAAHANRGWR